VEHVERVIYNRYKVTIAGSIPVQSASGGTKLQFWIEGEIDQKAVRSRPRTKFSRPVPMLAVGTPRATSPLVE
jgi:hypothetical protein